MNRARALPASAMALVTIGFLGLLSACSSDGSFGSNAEASELSEVSGSADLRIDATFSATGSAEEQGAEVSLAALESLRYSASQPDGIRATVYDHTVNVYGVDPATGFAARPLDNYGVQYGLAVLNIGEITKRQFLSLNRDVGGYDADLNHVPERHRAGCPRRWYGQNQPTWWTTAGTLGDRYG